MSLPLRRLAALSALAAVVASAAPEAAQAQQPAAPPAPAAAAEAGPASPITGLPEESAVLRRMWDEMADLRLGDDARWADNTLIEDGVCRAMFTKGILVPILSGGKGTTPERTVGAVFFGEGELALRFPDKGDALAFANHMALRTELERDALRPIVDQLAPWSSTFDRSIILTADSQLETLLRRLDPVGGGVMDEGELVTQATERGINEVYVVTSSKGEVQAKVLSRNILPDRRRALQRSGMDPVGMLRFDRMVHDHFGVPWKQLRMISEFRTDQRFHVAAPDAFVGDKSFDQWLTCFRDGIDHADTGLRSTALAHGTDPNGLRHSVKFSGERFVARDGGVPLPPSRIVADDADVTIELNAVKRLLYIDGKVTSTVRFQATEDGVQHFVMSLPRNESIAGRFKVNRLEMEDGRPLQFLELGAERATQFRDGTFDLSMARNVAAGQSSNDAAGAATSADNRTSTDDVGGNATAGADEIGSVSPGGDFVGLDEDMSRAADFSVDAVMGSRMDLLVVLPEPLADGDTIALNLDWEARWPFANWGVIYGQENDPNAGGSSTVSQYRPLGPTTGPRSFLPEMMPAMGGTEWDFRAKVTAPPRRIDVAISGDTRNEWLDEGNWIWIESRGRDARRPAVNAGRWMFYEEEAAQGLPGVRVHMFPSSSSSLKGFPGEVRRIFVFMKRFMPLPDFWELEVYEGQASVAREALSQARDLSPAGMVGIEKVQLGSGVTQARNIEEAYPQMGRTMLARQVMSQVWGQVVAPASERDAWVHEALVEAFGYFYVRAALQEDGFEAFETRLEYVRKTIEDPTTTRNNDGAVSDRGDHFLSLTDGGSFATQRPMVFRAYSFYVLGRMLRERIGDAAFFRAIDQLGRRNEGERITTELLQDAFERSSGLDLDDFFAYWVRGGFVPQITLEYVVKETSTGTADIIGCVTTDIPFGRFDMPVAVGGRKMAADIGDLKDLEKAGDDAVGGMIDVIDGRGPFMVRDQPLDDKGKIRVAPDPFGLVLAYKRVAKQVERTTCQEEGLQ